MDATYSREEDREAESPFQLKTALSGLFFIIGSNNENSVRAVLYNIEAKIYRLIIKV